MTAKSRARPAAKPVKSAPVEPAVSLSSHDRILEAAKRLFSERGYDHTSTSAIARLAGTSESQLMKHFGSKEGLLEAIFLEGWERMNEALAGIQRLPSPAEKLRALTDGILGSLERDPALKELMLLEGRRVRKEGHSVMMTGGYMNVLALLDSVLEEMRAAGQLRPELHPQAVRSALVGMFEALLRDQLLAERMDFPARYSAEDLRRVFALVTAAFLAAPR